MSFQTDVFISKRETKKLKTFDNECKSKKFAHSKGKEKKSRDLFHSNGMI